MDIFDLLQIAAGFIAVIFILAPHEWAHAFVATKCGDGTPMSYGRVTLNPLKHLDPVGFLCCAVVGFGWAKPVPINPANFKNYRKGLFLTAIAGVVMNYIIAFIAYLILTLFANFALGEMLLISEFMGYFAWFIYFIFWDIFAYSLCVFVFNLLPLYPLDGFRIVESCTREINPVRRFLRNYGQMILIILIAESFICGVLENYVSWAHYCDILGYILDFATEIIGFPIRAAWDWIYAI